MGPVRVWQLQIVSPCYVKCGIRRGYINSRKDRRRHTATCQTRGASRNFYPTRARGRENPTPPRAYREQASREIRQSVGHYQRLYKSQVYATGEIEQITSVRQHRRSNFYHPSSHGLLCQRKYMRHGQSVDIGRSLLSITGKCLSLNERREDGASTHPIISFQPVI